MDVKIPGLQENLTKEDSLKNTKAFATEYNRVKRVQTTVFSKTIKY